MAQCLQTTVSTFMVCSAGCHSLRTICIATSWRMMQLHMFTSFLARFVKRFVP